MDDRPACTVTERLIQLHDEERMLKHFRFDHLPPHLREVSRGFAKLALQLVDPGASLDACAAVTRGPERTVALRKLLEAKDAAVRARLFPGE